MGIKVMVAGKDQRDLSTVLKILGQEKNIKLLWNLDKFSETLDKLEKNDIDVAFIDTDVLVGYPNKYIKTLLNRYKMTKIILISHTTDYLNLAFDIMAAGYIIKPVKSNDVSECIERISSLRTRKGFWGIIAREKGRDVFVCFNEVLFIEALNRKCVIHTQREEYQVSKNLSDIANLLPEDIFFRSHRSYIINVTKIKHIEKYNNTSYNIIFGENKVALMSKRCERMFRNIIKNSQA